VDLQAWLWGTIAAEDEDARGSGGDQSTWAFRPSGEHDGHALLEQPTLQSYICGQVVHRAATWPRHHTATLIACACRARAQTRARAAPLVDGRSPRRDGGRTSGPRRC